MVPLSSVLTNRERNLVGVGDSERSASNGGRSGTAGGTVGVTVVDIGGDTMCTGGGVARLG